jgi:hypothetical protein
MDGFWLPYTRKKYAHTQAQTHTNALTSSNTGRHTLAHVAPVAASDVVAPTTSGTLLVACYLTGDAPQSLLALYERSTSQRGQERIIRKVPAWECVTGTGPATGIGAHHFAVELFFIDLLSTLCR